MNDTYKTLNEEAILALTTMDNNLTIANMLKKNSYENDDTIKSYEAARELTETYFLNLDGKNINPNGKEYEKNLFCSFLLWPNDNDFLEQFADFKANLNSKNITNNKFYELFFLRYDAYKKAVLEESLKHKNYIAAIKDAQDIMNNVNLCHTYLNLKPLNNEDLNLAISYLIWPNDNDMSMIEEAKLYYEKRKEHINNGNKEFKIDSIYSLLNKPNEIDNKDNIEIASSRIQNLIDEIKEKDKSLKEEIKRLNSIIKDLEGELLNYEKQNSTLFAENIDLKNKLNKNNQELEASQQLIASIYENLRLTVNEEIIKNK